MPTLFNSSTALHSGYGCGENGHTPIEADYYYDPSTGKDVPLSNFYTNTVKVDATKAVYGDTATNSTIDTNPTRGQ